MATPASLDLTVNGTGLERWRQWLGKTVGDERRVAGAFSKMDADFHAGQPRSMGRAVTMLIWS